MRLGSLIISLKNQNCNPNHTFASCSLLCYKKKVTSEDLMHRLGIFLTNLKKSKHSGSTLVPIGLIFNIENIVSFPISSKSEKIYSSYRIYKISGLLKPFFWVSWSSLKSLMNKKKTFSSRVVDGGKKLSFLTSASFQMDG